MLEETLQFLIRNSNEKDRMPMTRQNYNGGFIHSVLWTGVEDFIYVEKNLITSREEEQLIGGVRVGQYRYT